ncbi:MAG: cupredoxin domain-containing protein [Thermoleophilia bacterium]|nr:cupredoxin domain-containing protein [Thermoleophilia bacterium]
MKKHRIIVPIAVLVIAVAVAITLIGTSGSDSSTKSSTKKAASQGVDATVKVTMGEMYMKVDSATIPAGKIKFAVANTGKVLHEFVILKNDTPDGAMTVTNGKVSESTTVGEIGDVEVGASKSGSFQLTPGTYQLVCNIAGHYPAGMHRTFTVT